MVLTLLSDPDRWHVCHYVLFDDLPQQQRAKRHREMLETLKRGDQVVTAGGIRGKISKVHDETFDVEVAEGVVIQFTKASIADAPSRTTPPAAPSKGKTNDKTTGRANSKASDKK